MEAVQGRWRTWLALCGTVLALGAWPGSAARIVEVRVGRHADFARVVFETDAPATFAVEEAGDGEIRVRIDAASIARSVGAPGDPAPRVQLEPLPDGGSLARIRAEGPVRIESQVLDRPPRVVLDLHAAAVPSPAPLPAEAAAPEPAPPDAEPDVAAAPEPAAEPIVVAPALDAPLELAPPPPPVAAEPPPVLSEEPAAPAAVSAPPPRPVAPAAPPATPPDVVALALAIGLALGLGLGLVLAALRRRRGLPAREPTREAGLAEGVREGAPEAPLPVATAEVEGPQEAPALDVLADEPPARDAAAPRLGQALLAGPGGDTDLEFDLLRMLQRLDRRFAAIEEGFEAIRARTERIDARSAAQAEELAAQRAALTRFDRALRSPRPPHPPARRAASP